MDTIFPRSPREEMCGWIHLPRLVDKIRLHLAGKLHADYQENLLHHGFDKMWFDCAGIDPQNFLSLVQNTLTDGEVCDWVRANVTRTPEEKQRFNQQLLERGQQTPEMQTRLEQRKLDCGLSERNDIKTFIAFIDADEGR